MIWVKLIEVEPYPLEGQNNIQCQTSCPTHAGDKLMRIAVGHIQNIGQYCKPMQYISNRSLLQAKKSSL